MIKHEIQHSLLHAIHKLLRIRGDRLVLAESCTAGLVASSLGRIPGISDSWCGSLVVYRNASKSAWLGLDPAMLNDPSIGPVGEVTSHALVDAALKRTPEATIAAAITGHLGPDAPEGLDGRVFICLARKSGADLSTESQSYTLTASPPIDSSDIDRRVLRQSEAALYLLESLRRYLESA